MYDVLKTWCKHSNRALTERIRLCWNLWRMRKRQTFRPAVISSRKVPFRGLRVFHGLVQNDILLVNGPFVRFTPRAFKLSSENFFHFVYFITIHTYVRESITALSSCRAAYVHCRKRCKSEPVLYGFQY